ncbi:Uncharacterised protein [uncultured archaeon]|nr:Uncharacterised protein [uncultured archaeon]
MISVCYEVGRYRSVLAQAVRVGDVVVEIGPHLGQSTVPYLSKAKVAVAVEKGVQGEEAFKKLVEVHSNLFFVRGDARSFETVKEVFSRVKRCDVLAVDMGGGRYPDTVFKVWALWSGVFKPRDSVIRNRGVAEFVRRAKVVDDSLPAEFADGGWLSSYGRSTPAALKKQMEEFSFWVNVPSDVR